MRGRAYGDFRDYADVGGSREALKPLGSSLATTHPDEALRLAAARIEELERFREQRARTGRTAHGALDHALIDSYLAHLAGLGRATRHVQNVRGHLTVALEHFRPGRFLASVRVTDVDTYIAALRGRGFSPSTLRGYLSSLSGLYTYAARRELVDPGFNPVAAIEKPTARRHEARWLEVDQAARLLEAARRLPYDPSAYRARGSHKNAHRAVPLHELVATFLLTGGRMGEVLGLDLEDVSFDRRLVFIRPNRWRGLKTAQSARVVPLWPQLEAILRAWVFERDAPMGSGLLFPAPWGPTMLTDKVLWGALDVLEPGLRTRIFRHTYTAARLQTLDRGEPVSVWTVSRELGHASTERIERVYGHLGSVRHRAEVVEYRLPEKETVAT
ncbi:MAG TPA: tyrosine-type recombinase/integrase [Gemmatimonadota bacterium]|nr:tyrosine-type recombinase/integrase [Gemmatimonadota bacterium]